MQNSGSEKHGNRENVGLKAGPKGVFGSARIRGLMGLIKGHLRGLLEGYLWGLILLNLIKYFVNICK